MTGIKRPTDAIFLPLSNETRFLGGWRVAWRGEVVSRLLLSHPRSASLGSTNANYPTPIALTAYRSGDDDQPPLPTHEYRLSRVGLHTDIVIVKE